MRFSRLELCVIANNSGLPCLDCERPCLIESYCEKLCFILSSLKISMNISSSFKIPLNISSSLKISIFILCRHHCN